VRHRLFNSFVILYTTYVKKRFFVFGLDSLDSDISLKLTHELHKRKRRKNRTAFSAQQIYALEKRFAHQRYLTPNDRDQIANELQLSPAQVITVSLFY
jgi:NADH:ubiquinone oxidoreductase subunit E